MIPVIEGHTAPPPHQAHGTHHGLAAWDACGEGKAVTVSELPLRALMPMKCRLS